MRLFLRGFEWFLVMATMISDQVKYSNPHDRIGSQKGKCLCKRLFFSLYRLAWDQTPHGSNQEQLKDMAKKPTKTKSAPKKQKAVATKPEAGGTPTTETEAKKGQTTFLLRLPPDLRSALESFKDESGSKSLQNLILQLLAEGLTDKTDFRVAELFARDLHVASLAATVGSAPDDQAALLEAHQRVILELENQKLTSFASIMDPALLSYRLLIDYALQDPASRDPNGVVRDFSNGLKLSALQAMIRGKWSFAESLLLQAAASDPSNLEVSNEAGVYLLRRLVRRWYRPEDSITPGVCSQYLPWYHESKQQQNARKSSMAESDVVDETAWATALKAWNLLVHDDRPESADRWYLRWNREKNFGQELTRGNWRIEVWKRLATIIVCVSSPEPDDLKLLEGKNFQGSNLAESTLVPEIVRLFGAWEKGFRMTREVSRLQREWSEWFEPLEVLWWLGYRKEAVALAQEARGFVAEKQVMDRMALIRQWSPESENVEYYGDEDTNEVEFSRVVVYVNDENGIPEVLPMPDPLLNRPMSI